MATDLNSNSLEERRPALEERKAQQDYEVKRLEVLVEAGEDDRLGAGHRVAMALQALRADPLRHAIRRRILPSG